MTLTPIQLLLASLVVAVGSAVQGSVGIGLGLLAAPLMALIDPSLVPGPMLCGAVILTLLMAVRERAAMDREGVKWALVGRVPGNVLGAAALKVLPANLISLLFGGLVLLCVALSATRLTLRPTTRTLVATGLLSGFTGTTTAVGGPPIALVFQHEPGPRLRSTLAGYFVVGACLSLVLLVAVGRFGWGELVTAVALVPGILLGFALSRRATPLLDRGYTRPSVLVISGATALLVLLRGLLAL